MNVMHSWLLYLIFDMLNKQVFGNRFKMQNFCHKGQVYKLKPFIINVSISIFRVVSLYRNVFLLIIIFFFISVGGIVL